jgi:2-ketocyclohexanecarboxyl-CoA hydrolase
MDYEDLLYEVRDHVATITLNRPEVLNAFRGQTCTELVDALGRAGYDRDIAFCTGGDQSGHDEGGGYGGGRGTLGMPIDEVHTMMRDVPKPVVAKVRGYAIGGGNVLATICDLTLAAESAIFGQVGPKMGSVDPGFGTAYLSRVIGEKKAREFWFLCRRYSAQEACEMGLVNQVVPDDELDAEVDRWCAELVERSPTAIALAKRSFNADSEAIRGIGSLGFQAVALYYGTEESKEGGAALREKRPPRFREKS